MVNLEKMNKIDFEDYISIAINAYEIAAVKAGAWAEIGAHKLSKETFGRLLPNGIETEKEYLFTIMDIDEKIKAGYIWFECTETSIGKTLFIMHFLIFEGSRHKGYGTQTMKALEGIAKKLGINKISLHVFAHNKTALELYKKVGFKNTDIEMSKYILS